MSSPEVARPSSLAAALALDERVIPDDFGLLADSMPQLVWIARSDGSVTYYNNRYRHYSGIEQAPDGGWRWSPVIHPDDAEATMAEWARAAAAMEPYEFEHRLGMADGSYRWHISRALPLELGAAGEVIWFGTATDTHSQKMVEVALRESDQRFRNMADNAPVMIRVTEPDGSCTYLNRSWFEFTGQDEATALGGGWLDAVHADDRQSAQEALAAATKGRRALSLDYRLQRHDGEYRWAVDIASPRFGPGGAFLGHVGTVLDITDRKRLEEATHVARARAELLSELVTALENADRLADRARRVVEILVPRLADVAVVDLRHLDEPVLAVAATDARRVEELEDTLRGRARSEELRQQWNVWRGAGHGDRTTTALRVGTGGSGMLALEVGEVEHADVPSLVRGDRALLYEIGSRAELLLSGAELREREHLVAVRLQRALLPSGQLAHPNVDIAARYVAAAAALEVGGDWFETFDLPDGRVGFVVGDVVGHNLDAAVAMGQLRSGLLALAARTSEPGELLCDLHTFARRHHITDFATACCAVLDPATGELRYASAGHPPMLVVDETGEATWLSDGRSPPVGVAARDSVPECADATWTLMPGSLLVGYSDGLVERRGRSIDDGMLVLERLVRDNRRRPVEDLCDRVDAGMLRHAAEDDVVLLVVRFTGGD